MIDPCHILNPIIILERRRKALREGRRLGFLSSLSDREDRPTFTRKARSLKRVAFQMYHHILRNAMPTDSAHSGARWTAASLMAQESVPGKGEDRLQEGGRRDSIGAYVCMEEFQRVGGQ